MASDGGFGAALSILTTMDGLPILFSSMIQTIPFLTHNHRL